MEARTSRGTKQAFSWNSKYNSANRQSRISSLTQAKDKKIIARRTAKSSWGKSKQGQGRACIDIGCELCWQWLECEIGGVSGLPLSPVAVAA